MSSVDMDLAIWTSFKRGEWSAYAKLYDTYYRRLNNYGFKFTRDVSLIEDTVHDLFVKLWSNRENLGDPPSVKNYLYKSLRHILFRKIKLQSKFRILSDDDMDFTFEVSYDNQLILQEEEREIQQMLRETLNQLPARQQEIVYLRFYEGLSYEEIAEVMSINITSVYKLWYKALYNLQNILHSCLLFILLRYTAAFARES